MTGQHTDVSDIQALIAERTAARTAAWATRQATRRAQRQQHQQARNHGLPKRHARKLAHARKDQP